MPRGLSALRPVENHPTAHAARARCRSWPGCLLGQRATTPLAQALLHRHRARSATAASEPRDHSVWIPCRAARARFAPCQTGRLTTEHARAFRAWRGCLRGQRATRSTPRRWPRRLCTDNAPGRRQWDVNEVATLFESVAAGPARGSPRGEPADCPRNKSALANLAWLSSRATRDALLPTSTAWLVRTNTDTVRRHGVREVLITAFESRSTRRAHFTPRRKSADRPESMRSAARS